MIKPEVGKKKLIIKNLTSELCWWNSYRQFPLKISTQQLPINV
jgi:hypothetical protein